MRLSQHHSLFPQDGMTESTETIDQIVEASQTATIRRRFRRLMVVGLLLGILLGPYLFYRANSFQERVRVFKTDVSSTPHLNGDVIDLMVWNIAHGRGVASSNWEEGSTGKAHRVMEIAAFIRSMNADVVVLNEVDFSAMWSGGFDQAAAIAEAAGFPYCARQVNLDFGFIIGRFQFGNVILSRFPITNASVIDLPAFRPWEDWLVGCKRGLMGEMDLGSIGKINLAALHLDHRYEACRVDSVGVLINRFQETLGPLIVAGDLNTTPRTAPYSIETPDGENAFDLLVDSTGLQPAPLQVLNIDQLTFPAWAPERAIDWVLYRLEFFQLESHQVLRSQLSDHRPVMVRLKIKAATK